MPIPLPRLDDRSFAQLCEQAIARARNTSPEWTDFSPGDPGVTLLELFAYLTEAMLYRLNRVPPKLRIALLNLAGLSLHPPSAAVATLTFTRADGTVVTLADYDSAVSIERLDDEQKERRVADGAVTLAMLDEQATADPVGLMTLAAASRAALTAWDMMDRALADGFGRAKPSLGDVRALLERIEAFARRLAPSDGMNQDAAPVAAPAVEAEPARAAAPSAGGGAPGPIASRDDALRRLDEVAAWFRRNEPQSPMAYTLAEASRRGRMSLPDLLAELVPDHATRSQILTSLGIKPPPEEEQE